MAASHIQTNSQDLPDNPNAKPEMAKRQEFLDRLAETSNVSLSARKAKLPTTTVYRMRRQDPEFARQWLAALWEGYTHLEMEVLRRLREGDQKTKDSEKYDFANAIRLLNAHRENAARAQAEQRNVSAAEIRASIDRKVEAIRSQIRKERSKAAPLVGSSS